jgi:hypothetical protein
MDRLAGREAMIRPGSPGVSAAEIAKGSADWSRPKHDAALHLTDPYKSH